MQARQETRAKDEAADREFLSDLTHTLMQADGLHPNAAGQPLILETVWTALSPLLAR